MGHQEVFNKALSLKTKTLRKKGREEKKSRGDSCSFPFLL